MPNPALADAIFKRMSQSQGRIRVTVKGHVLWQDGPPPLLHLDGQAFGAPGVRADGQTPRTALIFPSGADVQASDFESWFFVSPQAPAGPLQVAAVNAVVLRASGAQT